MRPDLICTHCSTFDLWASCVLSSSRLWVWKWFDRFDLYIIWLIGAEFPEFNCLSWRHRGVFISTEWDNKVFQKEVVLCWNEFKLKFTVEVFYCEKDSGSLLQLVFFYLLLFNIITLFFLPTYTTWLPDWNVNWRTWNNPGCAWTTPLQIAVPVRSECSCRICSNNILLTPFNASGLEYFLLSYDLCNVTTGSPDCCLHL